MKWFNIPVMIDLADHKETSHLFAACKIFFNHANPELTELAEGFESPL
jgi:hypothetical protein